MSKFINSALEMEAEISGMVPIETNNVDAKELQMIIEYCTHYNFAKYATDIEKPLPSKDPKIYIKDAWERDFITKLS